MSHNQNTQLRRVAVYYDGFNLYHGIHDLAGRNTAGTQFYPERDLFRIWDNHRGDGYPATAVYAYHAGRDAQCGFEAGTW